MNTTTTTKTTRQLKCGDRRTDTGEFVTDTSPSVLTPGHITVAWTKNGATAAVITDPDCVFDVVAR